MTESGWLACSFCGLKHQRRPDGRCPRCGNSPDAPRPPEGFAPPPPFGPQPGAITSDDRTWGMLSHLGYFLGGPVLPIVALFTRGKQSPFVRGHAAAAIDNYLTQFIVVFGVMLISGAVFALAAAGMAASAKQGQSGMGQGAFGAGMGLFQCVFCVAFVFPILGTVCSILGAVAANKGDSYNYPWTFRIVR